MNTDRIALMPGVWLNAVQTDRFKTGCFSINFLRPLNADTAAWNALVPSVLLRGCESYPDMLDISNRLDELYGAGIGTLIRKKGEVQSVGMYADFLEDRYANQEPVFAQMISFLSDLMFRPVLESDAFVEEFVNSEALNLSNAIAAKINDKRAYAISRLLKHMCAGETYAVPRLGYRNSLEEVDAQKLLSNWHHIQTTSSVELFYLGRKSKEDVVETVRELLRDLPRGELTETPTMLHMPSREVQFVEEEMEVSQGKLTMGLRSDIVVSDSRYPAMMLLNAIFGAGMTSKLFLQIREEQSLCYYANSSMDKFKGIMLVDAGVAFENYEVARDGILHQLDLCRQGEITKEELESARNYVLSALRAGQDSPGRLDDYAIGQAIAGLTGSMADLSKRISEVTMDQVVEAANSLQLDTVYFLKGVGV